MPTIRTGIGLTINSSFEVDDRLVYPSVDAVLNTGGVVNGSWKPRLSKQRRYEGLAVWITEEHCLYRFIGGIDDEHFTLDGGGGVGIFNLSSETLLICGIPTLRSIDLKPETLALLDKAESALQSVEVDSTLTGDGTAVSPLGIAGVAAGGYALMSTGIDDGMEWRNVIIDDVFELQNALNSKANEDEVVKIEGDQVIEDTKTFALSPIVPAKSSPARDISTAIATEAQVFLKANDDDVVKLKGDQTIDDIKTFTTSPIVPSKYELEDQEENDDADVKIATEAQLYASLEGLDIEIDGKIKAALEGITSVGGTPGIVWSIRRSAADNAWQSLCFIKDTFVAVASNGTNRSMRSTNLGIDWSLAATAVSTGVWRSVCAGNNRLVAVGTAAPRTMWSVNEGASWTTSTAVTSGSWEGVCFGNNTFVMVGTAAPRAMFSTNNGEAWTQGNGLTAGNWQSVCFGEDTFVTVASNAPRVARSTDNGRNWTTLTGVPARTWRSVCFGNGTFVAVGTSGTNVGRAMYSTNRGQTWTECTNVPAGHWRSVCYSEEIGLFVAVSSAGGANFRVMTSEDGVTWTRRVSARDNAWRSVCFGASAFVAVADSGVGTRVMNSTAGASWIGGEGGELIVEMLLAPLGSETVPIRASVIPAGSDSGTSSTGARADHTHSRTSRTIIGNDAMFTAIADTGGDIAIPIPVTITIPSANSTQITQGTYSLRAVSQRLVDNVANLFSRMVTAETGIAGKQNTITATGVDHLLTAPASSPGNPGTRALPIFNPARILLTPTASGGAIGTREIATAIANNANIPTSGAVFSALAGKQNNVTGVELSNVLRKITTDSQGHVIGSTAVLNTDLPAHTHTTGQITGLGTAAIRDTGILEGQIPLLGVDGRLSPDRLPPFALMDIFVVSSQAAMFALSAVQGDIAIRTDVDETFIKLNHLASNDINNWQRLLTPADSVLSTLNSHIADNITANTTVHGIRLAAAGGTANANRIPQLNESGQIAIGQIPTQAAVSNVTTHIPTGAAVFAHTNATAAHDARTVRTANRIAMWDASMRLNAADPSAAQDVATKNYVDTTFSHVASAEALAAHIGETGIAVHGLVGGASTILTTNLTASRVLVSNANGKVAVNPVNLAANRIVITGAAANQLDVLAAPAANQVLRATSEAAYAWHSLVVADISGLQSVLDGKTDDSALIAHRNLTGTAVHGLGAASTMGVGTNAGLSSTTAVTRHDLFVTHRTATVAGANTHDATATPTASRLAAYNTNAKLSSAATLDTDATTIVATKGWVEGRLSGAGIGTVRSITAGAGLTGGTITSTGTIALGDHAISARTFGAATAANWGHVKFPTSNDSNLGMAVPFLTLVNDQGQTTVDLNNIRSPGMYRIPSTAVASSTPALPLTVGGTAANTAMLVVQSITNTRLSQTISHNNGQIWHRVLQNTTWRAWERIATTADLLSQQTFTANRILRSDSSGNITQIATTPQVGHVPRYTNATTIETGLLTNENIAASANIAWSKMAAIASGHLLGRSSSGTGAIEELSGAAVRTMIDAASGGHTHDTRYIRHDASQVISQGNRRQFYANAQVVGYDSLATALTATQQAQARTNIGLQTPTPTSTNATYAPWSSITAADTNLNTISVPGFYRINVRTVNSPVLTGTNANSAVMLVASASSTRWTQTMWHNNGEMWHRSNRNGTWLDWKRFATACELPNALFTGTLQTSADAQGEWTIPQPTNNPLVLHRIARTGNAAHLNGALNDARLSTNIPRLNGANTFTGTINVPNFTAVQHEPPTQATTLQQALNLNTALRNFQRLGLMSSSGTNPADFDDLIAPGSYVFSNSNASIIAAIRNAPPISRVGVNTRSVLHVTQLHNGCVMQEFRYVTTDTNSVVEVWVRARRNAGAGAWTTWSSLTSLQTGSFNRPSSPLTGLTVFEDIVVNHGVVTAVTTRNLTADDFVHPMDHSDRTVAFTQASTRANIVTGETLSAITGKLTRWFTDFRDGAWTATGNASGNIPTIGSDLGTTNNRVITTSATGALQPQPANIGNATRPVHVNDSGVLALCNPYPTSLPPSGTAGGELSGTYPNPSVTNAAVIGKVLTGLTAATGEFAAADTILQGFGKAMGRINAIRQVPAMNSDTNGQFLTNNGTAASWIAISSVRLRTQTAAQGEIANWTAGDIDLHRVARTGDYRQLGHLPTLGSISSLNIGGTTGHVFHMTGATTAGWGTLPQAAFANNTISLARIANMATARILGRTADGAGSPQELDAVAVRAMLNIADGATAFTGSLATVTTGLEELTTATSLNAAIQLNRIARTANASHLVAGTLADDRLSANVMLLGGVQTITGKKTFAASTTAGATINLGGTGTAPTTPADGDLWRTATDIIVRLGTNNRTLMHAGNTTIPSNFDTLYIRQNASQNVSAANAHTFMDNVVFNSPAAATATTRGRWKTLLGFAEPSDVTGGRVDSIGNGTGTTVGGTATIPTVNLNFGTGSNQVRHANDAAYTNDRNAADVFAWAKATVKPSYAFSEITGSAAIGQLPVAPSGTSNTTQVVRADDSRLSNSRTPTAHASTDRNAFGEASRTAWGHIRATSPDGTGTTSLGDHVSNTNFAVSFNMMGNTNQNLNNYRTPGEWIFGDSHSTTLNHPPFTTGVNNGIILKVMHGFAASHCVQLCMRIGSNELWIRNSTAAATWSSWTRFATTADVTGGRVDSIGNGTGTTVGGTATIPVINLNFGTGANQVRHANDDAYTNARNAADVSAWAKASTKPSYAFSEISGVATIGQLPVASSGTSNTTQVVRADDSRLSNSRTPTAHAQNNANMGEASTVNWGHVKLPTHTTASSGEVMPWVNTLPNTNLNEVKNPGFYKIEVATTNAPATTGGTTNTATLLVVAVTEWRLHQIFWHNTSAMPWMRVLQNTTWGSWAQLGSGGGGRVDSIGNGTGTTVGGTATIPVINLNFGTDANQVRHANDAAYTNARTPTAHNQALSTITGGANGNVAFWNGSAQWGTLSTGSGITGNGITSTITPVYGASANTVCQGNDSRLNEPSVWYGSTTTLGTTQTKEVTSAGFVLRQGATIHVNFSAANTHSTPHLNVNSTGAIPIHYLDNANNWQWPTTDSMIRSGMNSFTYINNHWIWLGAKSLPFFVPGGGNANQILARNASNNGLAWVNQSSGGTGTVTNVGAGNGMDFTAITGSGNVTLGTPSTCSPGTSNSVTATSHTHTINALGTSLRHGLQGNGWSTWLELQNYPEGTAATTNNRIPISNSSNTLTWVNAPDITNHVLTWNGSTIVWQAPPSGGNPDWANITNRPAQLLAAQPATNNTNYVLRRGASATTWTWETANATNTGARASNWVPDWSEVTGRPAHLTAAAPTTNSRNYVLHRNATGVFSWTEASSGGSGTVTQVNSGAGMNFTNFTTSGTITMGTPSSCSPSTGNSASGTTHTHTITGVRSDTWQPDWVNITSRPAHLTAAAPTTNNQNFVLNRSSTGVFSWVQAGTGGGGITNSITAGTGITVTNGTLADPTVAMANMAAQTLKGRLETTAGVPADLTRAQVLELLASVSTTTNNTHYALRRGANAQTWTWVALHAALFTSPPGANHYFGTNSLGTIGWHPLPPSGSGSGSGW